jgi:hypothetical protein
MRRLWAIALLLRAWRRRSPGPDHSHAAVVTRLEVVAEQLEDQLARSRTTTWPGVVAAVLGAVLLFGSLTWGLTRLDVSPPPTFPPEISIRGPGWPVTHRGMVIGTNLQVAGCDAPVEVTILAAATAEYWRRNRLAIAKSPRFELEVEGTHFVDVTAGLADARDNLDPSHLSLAPGQPRSARGVTGLRVRVDRNLRQSELTGRVEYGDRP